ncbi:helix-turn-helix domain-containing protein [Hymenobacter cellulosilyticus]|uniref:helix-turn-helix domain-containing protein n=1 Tax=Hymenobacter cellulosilyticus TaxID=2932248 RepID=UPI0035CC5592
MLAIGGVGMKKFENYGEVFIKAILEHGGVPNPSDTTDDDEDEDLPSAARKPRRAREAGDTHENTLQLHRAGLSVEAIAERRSLSPSTIRAHIETLYAKGQPIRLEEFLTMDEFAKIQTAIGQLGGDPPLRDLFDHLREQYDYFKLRLAVMYQKRLRSK